jgi:hypothetical protein
MDKAIEIVVARAVDDAERYPFLFIGSGLSRRYAGSPNWAGLLRAVCEGVLGDEFAYARYDARAKTDMNAGQAISELPHVATLMEPDVNAVLLSSRKFDAFRKVHRGDLLSGASPFKIFVADLISGYGIRHSEETKILSRVGRDKVSGVITTNYDALCETLFPTYETYVGERNLLFSEPSFAQEIYEIHGSTKEPDSMVLTDADYAEFSARRKYLSAKLLTIFVEYPVVFLGYSIQDENVKSILADVCECMPPKNLGRLHNRLIFVQHGNKTTISDHSMDLNGHMLSMTCITTDDFMSVYEALLRSQRVYSPKVIRELRGSVFKLAERIDPASEVVTSGFDAVLDHMEPGQKIAIQIATTHANIGRPISSEDIFQDVVLDDLHLDPHFVVDSYLSAYIRRLPNVMPVFKYIQDMNDDEVEKGVLDYARGLFSLDNFRNASIRKTMDATHRRFSGHTTVSGLEEVTEPGKLFYFIPQLYDDEIDVDDLERVLKSALLATEDGSDARTVLLKESNFRKCVRIYDFLRYASKR